MLAGHVGAALALGRADRDINVGTLVFAALLPDVLLWCFVLLGLESISIPADFAGSHQLQFTFPYSHSLMVGLCWAALAAIAAYALYLRHKEARLRHATVVGAAVLSHWFLDALVHVPELPLAGAQSTKVGLGLWQSMPVALTVEALIVVTGLCLYLPGAPLPRRRRIGLSLLSAVVLGFTIVGTTVGPAPPSAHMAAASSLVTVLIISGLASWCGRAGRQVGQSAGTKG